MTDKKSTGTQDSRSDANPGDKKNTPKGNRTGSPDDFGGALLGLAVIGLAGYGLLKLLSSESESRHSYGHRREKDILSRLMEEELL